MGRPGATEAMTGEASCKGLGTKYLDKKVPPLGDPARRRELNKVYEAARSLTDLDCC